MASSQWRWHAAAKEARHGAGCSNEAWREGGQDSNRLRSEGEGIIQGAMKIMHSTVSMSPLGSEGRCCSPGSRRQLSRSRCKRPCLLQAPKHPVRHCARACRRCALHARQVAHHLLVCRFAHLVRCASPRLQMQRARQASSAGGTSVGRGSSNTQPAPHTRHCKHGEVAAAAAAPVTRYVPTT